MSTNELVTAVAGAFDVAVSFDASVVVVVVAAAFVASVVTGALGYGFSSVTVPAGLAVTTSRVLNPALVLVEVVVNAGTVFANRDGLRAAWPHVRHLLMGLLPGVLVGALILDVVSAAHLKASTYAVLLPLVLLQLWLRRRRTVVATSAALRPSVGAAFGAGLGVLYATTTLSGPPLALFFSARGLVHADFRAALAVVRVIEAALALIAYAALGLLHKDGAVLAALMFPVVAIGLPLGRRIATLLSPAAFSSVVLGTDAVLVSIGLAATALSLGAPTLVVAGGAVSVAILVGSAFALRASADAQHAIAQAAADPDVAVEVPQP